MASDDSFVLPDVATPTPPQQEQQQEEEQQQKEQKELEEEQQHEEQGEKKSCSNTGNSESSSGGVASSPPPHQRARVRFLIEMEVVSFFEAWMAISAGANDIGAFAARSSRFLTADCVSL